MSLHVTGDTCEARSKEKQEVPEPGPLASSGRLRSLQNTSLILLPASVNFVDPQQDSLYMTSVVLVVVSCS